jgi:predicted phosphodiesterase
MIGLFSDAHLGPGGMGDVANRRGLELVLGLLFGFPITALYILGDFLDFDRYGIGAVLDAPVNRDFLCRLGRRARAHRVRVVWVKGNHDDFTVAETAQVLAVLQACGLEVGEWFEIRDGLVTTIDEDQPWILCHGHDPFDRLNSGWFSPVASGLTWVSGQVGRMVPGWDDRYINPVNLLRLNAHTRSQRGKALLRSRAGRYATEQGCHLALGHTHDLLEDDLGVVHIVNTGCVTKGRASAVLIQGSQARLFPLQGEF